MKGARTNLHSRAKANFFVALASLRQLMVVASSGKSAPSESSESVVEKVSKE
jgi:hypothetical protein